MTIVLSYGLKNALADTLDFKKILTNHPDLIDFKKLSANGKAELLNSEIPEVVACILNHGLTADEKYYIICNNSKLARKHKIVLDKQEYTKLNDSYYSQLLKKNFNDYYCKDRWEKMGEIYKREVSSFSLKDVIAKGAKLPKLTYQFFRSTPKEDIEKYLTDEQIGQCTSGWIWTNLIEKDKTRFIPLFLDSVKRITPATEIRSVFYHHPELIKHLTLEVMSSTKSLTCKQWLLLMRTTMVSHAKEVESRKHRKNKLVNVFDGWKPTQEFIDGLELDLNIEMLNGKSKVTKQFQNARQFLKDLADGTLSLIEEDEDEDTTVV